MTEFLDEDDPEIQEILKGMPEKKQQFKPLPKFKSCAKCGQIGHITSDCPNSVTTNDLEIQIERRIEAALLQAPDSWIHDEFGLYKPSESNSDQPQMSREHSWKEGNFCFNCGQFGHHSSNCKEPDFSTLYNDVFGKNLMHFDAKSNLEKSNAIKALQRFCLQNSKE